MKLRRVLSGLVVLAFMFVLFACGEKDVKITFETNGGSAVNEIVAKAGSEITKPADPTKADVTFGGWYEDIDLTEKYEFPATMPSESITIYAKWVVTLTFDSKGGPAIDPIVGEGGKTFKMPADPVRDGFIFIGWYTDAAYTKLLTYVMPKTNTTAYAKWQVLETGSAVTVPLKFVDNDNVYITTETETGVKFTATDGKDVYSYMGATIPCGVKNNNTVVVELIGTKGVNVILKVEGGDAEGQTEQTFEMTGEVQKCIWSDEASKFSSIGGSRFLVFLNGGTAGCGTTPEYVEIRSVKLYRTVEPDAQQKAAIYFVPNGGSEVAEIYDVPGKAVTKPDDPEKMGYVFDGWYSDSAFTTPFEFTTLPATGAMAYAKWKKAKAMEADVDILGEATSLTEGAYVTSFENEVLSIKKTATGGEWDCVALAWPEAQPDMSGYDHLLVSIYGPKDQEIMFKINDTVEKTHKCTGGYETIEFEFDHVFNMEKFPIVMFVGPNKAGESGEVQIGYLAYANHQTIFSLMDARIEIDEGAPTSLVKKDGTLVLKKEAADETTTWSHARLYIEGDLSNCNYVQFIVKGTAGERMLIKPFDGQDMFVDLTGEMQGIYLPITATYDSKKAAVVLFANPNAIGTGHEIIIYDAMLIALYQPPVPKGDVNLLDYEVEPLHTSLKANYELSLSKDPAAEDPNWKCAVGELVAPDYEGITKLVYAVKGTAGETIKIKVNDQVEFDVACTGEVIEGEYTLPDNFEFNDTKYAIVVFCNPNAAGTGNPFSFSKLQYEGENKTIDLLNADWRSLDEGVYTVSKKLVISKDATGTGYEAVVIKVTGDFGDYAGVKYTVKGTAGQKLLFKVDDVNAGETWLDLTGEVQTGILTKIPEDYDPAKSAMVLFPDGGVTGTGNAIEILELVFLAELPEE